MSDTTSQPPVGANGEDIRPVRSILDTDLYKLTQQQAIRQSDIEDPPVTYRFTNRTKQMRFTKKCVDQIQHGIDGLANLALQSEERQWLEKNCPYLKPKYLDYLEQFRFMPREQVKATFVPLKGQSSSDEEQQGDLELAIEGTWSEVILYEVPLMSIVSETYFRIIDTKWDMTGQRCEWDDSIGSVYDESLTM